MQRRQSQDARINSDDGSSLMEDGIREGRAAT